MVGAPGEFLAKGRQAKAYRTLEPEGFLAKGRQAKAYRTLKSIAQVKACDYDAAR